MRVPALFLAVLAFVAPAVADPAEDYLRDVKPVLEKRCYACHGALQQRSGLRLDTAASIAAGGDSGQAIEPGQPDDSLLIMAATGEGMTRMPLEGQPLSAEEIEAIRRWIAAGAPHPEGEKPQPRPEDHWSFQPPTRPALPTAGDSGNPVDAFIASALSEQQLTPAATASPQVLLRRVHLDLVGVPPTRDELRAFLSDPSPAAYAEVVDRLLASPLYGQRWGRHWMDVWRYSDWAGYGAEVRDSQQHIWHWRDWIIESLNADRGYDQMVLEMLAGDELAPGDPDVLRATGFLARNWYRFNRNVWLDNTVEHTGKAFLGLTFNCARCHDHKYDPIAQTDFYRLRAFFEPYQVRVDRLPEQPDVNVAGIPRVYDDDAATPTYLFVRGNEADPDKEHPLEPGLPPALVPDVNSLAAMKIALPLTSYYEGARPAIQEEMLAAARQAIAAATDDGQRAAATAQLAALDARIAADRARYADPAPAEAQDLARKAQQLERAAAVASAEAVAAAARIELTAAQENHKAGKKKSQERLTKAEEAEKQAAEKLTVARNEAERAASGEYTPLTRVYPATSTGRRLALARWIADDRNPLTPRVAVNHIWLRHFGAPLVESVFDFGHHGQAPSNPPLLDWLAVEFIESGWSMKHIHRLIVTSAAYARASTTRDAPPESLAGDPDNRYLWRMNARRMEGEVVRDSVLHVGGALDLALGGPDIAHDAGLTVPRRSLYFQHANEKQMTFLKLFDAAGVTECYRRSESIVPQQGLALANSALARDQARRIAAQLHATEADEFIELAFEQVLSRSPSADELRMCREFLDRQAALLASPAQMTAFGSQPAGVAPSADPAQRAREDLVHVLLNHNDFVTIR